MPAVVLRLFISARSSRPLISESVTLTQDPHERGAELITRLGLDLPEKLGADSSDHS
jgi:hypothetical protein